MTGRTKLKANLSETGRAVGGGYLTLSDFFGGDYETSRTKAWLNFCVFYWIK